MATQRSPVRLNGADIASIALGGIVVLALFAALLKLHLRRRQRWVHLHETGAPEIVDPRPNSKYRDIEKGGASNYRRRDTGERGSMWSHASSRASIFSSIGATGASSIIPFANDLFGKRQAGLTALPEIPLPPIPADVVRHDPVKRAMMRRLKDKKLSHPRDDQLAIPSTRGFRNEPPAPNLSPTDEASFESVSTGVLSTNLEKHWRQPLHDQLPSGTGLSMVREIADSRRASLEEEERRKIADGQALRDRRQSFVRDHASTKPDFISADLSQSSWLAMPDDTDGVQAKSSLLKQIGSQPEPYLQSKRMAPIRQHSDPWNVQLELAHLRPPDMRFAQANEVRDPSRFPEHHRRAFSLDSTNTSALGASSAFIPEPRSPRAAIDYDGRSVPRGVKMPSTSPQKLPPIQRLQGPSLPVEIRVKPLPPLPSLDGLSYGSRSVPSWAAEHERRFEAWREKGRDKVDKSTPSALPSMIVAPLPAARRREDSQQYGSHSRADTDRHVAWGHTSHRDMLQPGDRGGIAYL